MKTTGIAMWAYTRQPDTKFDACWRITIVMSDEEAAKLKEVGLKVKRNDDGAYEYKFKRNCDRKKNGEVIGKNDPPRVVDAQKNTFVDMIGNGSRVNVQWSPFSWAFKGKKGISADFVAVQVLDLVPYTGGGTSTDEFDSVESTESTAPTSTDDEW